MANNSHAHIERARRESNRQKENWSTISLYFRRKLIGYATRNKTNKQTTVVNNEKHLNFTIIALANREIGKNNSNSNWKCEKNVKQSEFRPQFIAESANSQHGWQQLLLLLLGRRLPDRLQWADNLEEGEGEKGNYSPHLHGRWKVANRERERERQAKQTLHLF